MDAKSNTLIIAEIAQAHDGSLGMAHAYIDAAAEAGADAVKFQTHIAAAESTPAEPWRIKFSRQDATRYEYWKRMEFTEEQWLGLKQHALERGLQFLSSPFSMDAVELLFRVGVSAWKIASGEVSNTPLFERIMTTNLPILLSTGMSPLKEIDAAVERIKKHHIPLTVFQCTSMYPTPPEKLGINLLPFFRERYHCDVGLSDHSGTIYAGLAATSLGANAVEVHITFSRDLFGPDVPASLTPLELRQMVEGIRFIEKALTHPVDKDVMAADLMGMRKLFTKSVVTRTPLDAGTILQAEHLITKKPGTGIPAEHLPELLGRTLKKNVPVDHLLTEADLE